MAVTPLPAIPAAPVYNPANGLDIIGQGPTQDPQYLAYLRASGATEAELRATTLAKQDAIDRALQQQLPTFQQQLQKTLGDTGQVFAGNGTFNSGGRLYQQTQDTINNSQQVTKAQQDAMNQKSDLEEQLAAGVAKEREAQAEQGLTARSNVALASNAAVNGSATAPTAGSSRTAGSSNLTGV
jgi:hypothetical protein